MGLLAVLHAGQKNLQHAVRLAVQAESNPFGKKNGRQVFVLLSVF